MKYSAQEVMQYVQEADVKFIRLAFCDVYGKQKNIAIMPGELERAFAYGVAIDASAIAGFGSQEHSDLYLHPDPATLTGLPWRPENGRVVRMLCDLTYPDGSAFPCDTRALLKQTVQLAKARGYTFDIGTRMEFYLFKTDENGEATREPYDQAGYMDIAPEDKGENVRREICLNLEKMGIQPESSHHEEGPGQNEISFRYSDPVTAADNAVSFAAVVKTIAARNGLYADFSPKPLADQPGNGMHINVSVDAAEGEDELEPMTAGLLAKCREMTLFLNPSPDSYRRLGGYKAPGYVTWSTENRSQLIRMPAAVGRNRRLELRSADSTANPYIAFTLLIRAGLLGIQTGLELPPATDRELSAMAPEDLAGYDSLPRDLAQATSLAAASGFVAQVLPPEIIRAYCG